MEWLRRLAYLGVARSINRIDLSRDAAAAMGIATPSEPLRASRLFDGGLGDGSHPRARSRSAERTSALSHDGKHDFRRPAWLADLYASRPATRSMRLSGTSQINATNT
jgi:hypothetical protein